MWSDISEDIRYTFRTLRRTPGFAAIAILIIALGIGANTAIFSVVHTLLVRPLPFRDPERLVWVANVGTDGGLSSVTLRTSNLRDWRRLNRTFEEMTGYFAFYDYLNYTLTGDGEPQHLVGVGVAPDFLEVLGIPLQLGRNFNEEEGVWNGPPAIVLTHSFWQRRFGADPNIVGSSVTLNAAPTTVIGVLPPWFDFASVFTPGARIDFLTPFPICDETDQWGNTLAVIGRLRPGATIPQAQADLDAVNTQLREAEPDRWGLYARVGDLREQVAGPFRPAVLVLAAAVGLVLLIVCANLSSMLLARAAARRREIAVRSALGASRARLVRQVLTESLVLAFAGAVGGVLLAYLITRGVAGLQAVSIPLLEGVGVDGTALLFTVVVTVVTGLLFGLVPALSLAGAGEQRTLREEGRGASEGRRRRGLREALVVAEVALACVLLVGAGLLLRSFVTLLDVDLGFQPEGAAAWRIETTRSFEDGAELTAFYDQLVQEVRTVPGVEAAGITDTLPLGRNRAWSIGARGVEYAPGERPIALRLVDPGYLPTMRIPLLAGRNFTPEDDQEGERVIILNESAARRLWPDQDPIGQAVLVGPEYRVVGLVADVRHASLEESAGLEMYLPIAQVPPFGTVVDLAIRSSLPAESLAPAVASVLRGLDSTMPTGDWRPLTELVDRAVSPRRFIMQLLGSFAGMALLLAALGIYGVIAYSVSQQSREIGIRMALGATASSVRGRVLVRTLALTGAGIVLGTAAALGLARLIGSLLYGVEPTDPLTLTGMVLILGAVALLAGYLPARRASRIDPVKVLGSA